MSFQTAHSSADNREAARNFHHEWATYDSVEVIGRSEHVQSLIDSGRLSASCGQAGGISIQPNEGLGHGTTIKNSKFSGFDVGCTGGKNSAIYVEHDQVRNAVADAAHTIFNNTYGPLDSRLSACLSINNSPDGWVRYIAIEDPDGTMNSDGVPGFYIQDEPAVTNFIDTTSCHAAEGCLRFCPGACLRLGIVSISQDLTTRNFNMHIQDGTASGTVLRGPIWFNELQNHLSAQMPFQLPAPKSGQYSISFTDANGLPAWPGFAKVSLEKAPTCSGALVDLSQVNFVKPVPDERCENLFFRDDYAAGIHGWQHFFAGLSISEEGGSYVISTTRRKSDRGHVNLSRSLDSSCFAGLGGRTFTLFGKIRTTDGSNYVSSSPRLRLALDGWTTKTWNLPTNADGTWFEFSKDVTLPNDSSSISKVTIILDQAEKKEFQIVDWGMMLVPSEAPTSSPTTSPTLAPTTMVNLCLHL